MKSIRIRVLKFAIVAVIIAIGIFFITNRYKARESTDIADFTQPSMPVMCMIYNGTTINKMFGYQTEVNPTTERDSLTPLLSDRGLTVQVNPYGNEIDSLSYELTSLMDGSFVENGTVSNLQADENGFLTASFSITTPILMDQEYSLKFEMKTRNGGEEIEGEKENQQSRTIYYYTRVIQQTGTNLTDYLNFASTFYNKCLDKTKIEELASSIETDEMSNGSINFDDVTLQSSLDLVTWGNLSPQLYMGATPQVRELNNATASIVMDYVITSENIKKQTEFYHVTDSYRLHNNLGVVVMTDFDRDVEQLFDPELSVYRNSGISLGVRSTSLEYVFSENEQFMAFVTSGELWVLNDDDDGYVQNAFSFRRGQAVDERNINKNHDIKVCNVSDEGVVTFIVYGYMNNGDHEGQMGAVIYTYSAEENFLREQLFIPFEQNYEYVNYYLSSLTNVSDDGIIYMYTGDALQTIDLATGTVGAALEDVNTECFATSDTQTYAAWMDDMDPYHSKKITFFNVKTGEKHKISAPKGEKIKIIGFFGEDLVYGFANDADILSDAAGNTIFGMNRICIETADGKILKEYKPQGTYITRLMWAIDHLEIELSVKNETGTYTYNSSDHIISNTNKEDDEISVVTEKDSRCSQIVILPFMANASGSSVQKEVSNYTINYKQRTASMSIPTVSENQYLVYYDGGLQMIDTQVNNAIHEADENGGIVLDCQQKYVYERGNWRQTITLEPETLPQQLLNPVLDARIVQDILGDGYKLINYTGCSIESIRYQISRGYPVIAKYSENRTILLIGYDRFDNLWYYDVELGEPKAIGDIDAVGIFGNQGYVFLSYIRTDWTSAQAEASIPEPTEPIIQPEAPQPTEEVVQPDAMPEETYEEDYEDYDDGSEY